MGLFRTKIEVGHPIDRRFEEIEAVVDTGEFCSMFPASLFHQLGITSDSEREFTLADGRKQKYPMGEARFRWEGLERTSSIIFGPEGVYLLGALTLQSLNLIADNTHHRLIPTPELLLVGVWESSFR